MSTRSDAKEQLKELMGKDDALEMVKLSGIDLSDIPDNMTQDDYYTVFSRVITPEVYALVVAACATKAMTGSVKAQELIMLQAQGTPGPRQGEASPQYDALMRLQEAMLKAGQPVEYSILEGKKAEAYGEEV